MFLLIQKELRKLAKPQKTKIFARFFKTGKGEYGEGDKFLGIMTGPIQELARKYEDLSFSDLQKLLNGVYHEERTLAVMILVRQFQEGEGRREKGGSLRAKGEGRSKEREEIFKFYLKNTKRINNWDLVDISAPQIVGEILRDKDIKIQRAMNREILYKLAKSENLWEKRIAIMSTFAFIRENDFSDTLKISEILINDKHDLIHKACGWLLREVGKRDLRVEEEFLNKFITRMPRTMLRYAIEKFPESVRQEYLKKK